MLKFPYKFIAIDLETTDIDPEKGSICQIGAVYVDKELNIVKTFNEYVKPLDDHRNKKAMQVNKIEEKTLEEKGLNLHQALGAFEFFCGDARQLAAWGAHFDLPFLKKQYEKINRKYWFSYRHFDIKSAAIWEMARRGTPMVSGVARFCKANGLEFEGTAHDALSDIENSVKLLQYFRDN